MMDSKLKVEEVLLSELLPYDNNVKMHPSRQIGRIVDSIREFGFNDPIAIDERSKIIITGHGRFEAAKKLEMETIPVIKLGHLTEAQRRAYSIVHNKTTLDTGFDIGALKIEFDSLKEMNFDLKLTGFSERKITEVLMSDFDKREFISKTLEKIEEPKRLQGVWKTEERQIWRLGDHRVMCGDCLVEEDVKVLMRGSKADLIVTSPPYNIKLDTYRKEGKGLHKEKRSISSWRMASAYEDSKPEPLYRKEQVALIDMLYDYSTDSASFFYNHKIRLRKKVMMHPLEWLSDTKWLLKYELVWNKKSSIILNAMMYNPVDERIYWLHKGDYYFANTSDIKSWSSVWDITARVEVKGASVPFPRDIPYRIIIGCSREKDLILDPYGGTGTTLVVCEGIGRKCYMMEIDPTYVATIIQRWVDETGREPVLEGSA